MERHDIDPSDIDPETGRPYPGYSSPALDTSFHDHEMDVDEKCSHGRTLEEACRKCQADLLFRAMKEPVPRMDDEDDGYPPRCSSRLGHAWVVEDCEHGEGRCYCENCGADGDA